MPMSKLPTAGGGPKEATTPPGMPRSIDQGLPQFGTGDGIGGVGAGIGGGNKAAAGGGNSPFARNKGFASAFKGIPQLDSST